MLPQFLGVLALLWLLSGTLVSAQIVGTKDLTHDLQPQQADVNTTATSQRHDYCFPSGGNGDGVMASQEAPVLTLSVSKADLVIVDQRPGVDLTVTLTNHGVGPALVPWTSSPVEPAKLSEKSDLMTEGYEVATIDFFVGYPHTEDKMLGLRSYAALWSQPENLAQSIKMRAGESVEVKIRADIVCRLADSTKCAARLREGKLKVSAWWYQRLLTESRKGSCIFRTDAFMQREIDSKTVDIGSTPLKESQEIRFTPITVSNSN